VVVGMCRSAAMRQGYLVPDQAAYDRAKAEAAAQPGGAAEAEPTARVLIPASILNFRRRREHVRPAGLLGRAVESLLLRDGQRRELLQQPDRARLQQNGVADHRRGFLPLLRELRGRLPGLSEARRYRALRASSGSRSLPPARPALPPTSSGSARSST